MIEIPGNGVFMVHDPKMGARGYFSAEDFVKAAEELNVIKNSIVNGYALKTKKDPEEIAAIMAAETWYDGKQAVDAGFCDRLMFEDAKTSVENMGKVVVNSVSMDLERFGQFVFLDLIHSRFLLYFVSGKSRSIAASISLVPPPSTAPSIFPPVPTDRRIFRRWADLAGGCDSGSPETRFPQAGNLFEVKGGKRNGY